MRTQGPPVIDRIINDQAWEEALVIDENENIIYGLRVLEPSDIIAT